MKFIQKNARAFSLTHTKNGGTRRWWWRGARRERVRRRARRRRARIARVRLVQREPVPEDEDAVALVGELVPPAGELDALKHVREHALDDAQVMRLGVRVLVGRERRARGRGWRAREADLERLGQRGPNPV